MLYPSHAAQTEGIYGIYNRLNIFNEVGEGARTHVNGVSIDSYQFSSTTGSSNIAGFTHFENLRAGDQVEFFHFHLSSGDRENRFSYVSMYRLSGFDNG